MSELEQLKERVALLESIILTSWGSPNITVNNEDDSEYFLKEKDGQMNHDWHQGFITDKEYDEYIKSRRMK